MGRRKAQGQPWEGLKVVHPNAAGLDIGSEEIWAAVAPPDGSAAVRKFGTFTPDLAALADWLAAHGVETVAMSPQSAFGAFYRRIKGRLGTKQAIVATAHKIARAFYYVLKHRVPFDDLGGEAYERLANPRERKHLEKRAAKLGLALVRAS